MDATGPLSGVKVLDLSSAVMGPYATQILGDFGADVIRVEPLRDVARHSPANTGRTPGMAPLYMQVNQNKRSIELDLKDPAGREDLFALLADADVLVTNMRAAALDRLGLGYEQLRERFPRLVYAHAQGFAPARRAPTGPPTTRSSRPRPAWSACRTGRAARCSSSRPSSPTRPPRSTCSTGCSPRSSTSSAPARASRSNSRWPTR